MNVTRQIHHHLFSTGTINSTKECVTRKFVFHNSKITQLKAMAAAKGVNNPTLVYVIGRLISKRSIAAATRNLGSIRPPSTLFQSVAMSPKMAEPLPQTCVGNLRALSEQIKKRNMELKRSVEENEESKCKSINDIENVCVITASQRGDAIEAVVSLEEGRMATLEGDKQLLQFASLHHNGLEL